ncbi:MAG: hypothetical protein UU88_C0001G0045 [Parcubacteria group bacterium GW2011_GWC1_42_11]|uniref:Uncharacterized protein n=1 Tax=Candidatus Nomurabacteria bacterium GW2011_GWC2_42_20 TaxID=1618756 RepID=A0A0G0ZHH8_9BACT|nr:MAG: hypothetical protein UU88_C0001G0045 [Parcubacteria group bacterium GW2011_GWC1_42_11]KKS48109.1 MAG: hypothetical protein UV12_C0003G0068 [Candidatus Nomurabacteria bacterium GW2011_GWC2_42_20]KKS58422.1 MAG: hypothetical protein UV24_C0023G0006 [Candidatus Nomurabacteria bacterium GW2011_GWA2_42_41]KKT09226.1 MAG: hypothetical protein UV86_C0011G0010 [Candidatus Nomurabacteria bacterium GW2011_GWB1_43_20]TAN36882.1 MAG: hypothetical protein EPN27_00585 [Patescibacteria group bacterium
MIETLGVIILFVFIYYILPTIIICGGYLLYKIWSANPYEVEKVQQMKHTVKLANAGNQNAILACEEDYQIRKSIRYVDGQIIAHYSVPSWMTLRAFGF